MNNTPGSGTPVIAPVAPPVTASESSVAGSSVTTAAPAGAPPEAHPVAGSPVAPPVTPVAGSSVTTAAPPEAPPVTAPVTASESSGTPPETQGSSETQGLSVTQGSETDCDCKNGWLDKIVLSINNLLLSNSIIASNKTKSQYFLYFFIFLSIGFLIWISYDAFKEGFGEDTKEENSKKVKIDEVERQLQDRITSINTNLTSLKKRMDDADIVKDNKPTNLAIAIQNNILAVKEAMMKIIAGLVIQTKMNNGALNVVSKTNAFQKNMTDSINNLTNPK